jgi:hypothetical protein
MTDQDTLLMLAAGLLAVWWLVQHPGAAKPIGAVVLIGLVCSGAEGSTGNDRTQRAGAS